VRVSHVALRLFQGRARVQAPWLDGTTPVGTRVNYPRALTRGRRALAGAYDICRSVTDGAARTRGLARGSASPIQDMQLTYDNLASECSWIDEKAKCKLY
jgi:hypothetical protein